MLIPVIYGEQMNAISGEERSPSTAEVSNDQCLRLDEDRMELRANMALEGSD